MQNRLRLGLRLLAGAGAVLAGAAGALGSPASRAQEPAPTVSIVSIDASAYPDITAIITVTDADGVPVQGLAATSFTAGEAETALEVVGAQPAQDASLPLSVIIVIDTSGSMQGQPIIAARDAATAFVQQLGPNDLAALVPFSADVAPGVPLTTDKAQLTQAIATLQAEGATALYKAVAASTFIAATSSNSRKAIVLLSDGQNDSQAPDTREGSLAAVDGANVPVFAIGLGPQTDEAYLQELAAITQGRYYAATAGTVQGVYNDVATLLRSQYVLTLRASQPVETAGPSTLRVGIAGNPSMAELAFERPGAPPAVPTVPAQVAEDDGGGGTPAIVFGGVFAGALLMGLAALGFVVLQRTRTRRRQLAVVRPNLEQARAQSLPVQAGSVLVDVADGMGRLTALNGDEATPARDFGSTPVRIGSSPECDVRVPSAADVAPQHAMLWMKDGKIMLRHVGGPRRATLVAGRPADWVILDSGDEFVVGPHRYRAEKIG